MWKDMEMPVHMLIREIVELHIDKRVCIVSSILAWVGAI